MSVLLCVRTNSRAREVGARVTRLRAAAAAVGRGSRAAPGRRGRWRHQYSGGAGRHCPRTTPARPELAPLRPSGRPGAGSMRRAPEQGKHRAPAPLTPRQGAREAQAGPAAPEPRGPRAPGARRPARTPGSPATAAPGLGLGLGLACWARCASLWAQEDGAASGLARPSRKGARERTGDLPRPPAGGESPSLRTNPCAAALPGSRPRALASLAPCTSPAAPSSAPVRRRGPQASAGVRARAWAQASDAALRAHAVTRGLRHIGGWGAGKEMAASARPRRRQSKAGDGARRVAHGQAQGMKGSLSSSDTAAVSSCLPLPRP